MIGIVWVLVFVLGLVPPLLREAHTDISWPFYLVDRMLAGARQGRDFFEVNPPLFLWLAAPAVLIERISGIPAWTANIVMTAGLAAISLLLSLGIVRRLVPDQRDLWVLMLATGVAALLLPRLDFAQREHLAFLCTLPYIVLAAARIRGLAVSARVAMGAGVLGAVGFSLKPHFLLAWLLLESFLLVRLRRGILRTELWILVGFGVLYLVCVLLFVPDYLPMAFRLRPWYERYLDNGWLGAVVLAGPLLLLTTVIALAQLVAAREDDALMAVLAVAFFGFLSAAILQRKGFGYHYLAASCFGLVLLVRGWQVLPPLPRPLLPSALLARAGILMALLTSARAASAAALELANPKAGRYRNDPSYQSLLPVVKQLAQGQPILVLSSNPSSGWPLTRDAGAVWASRYMSFWPLPALYHRTIWRTPPGIVEPNRAEMRPRFEQQFIDDVVADLERWPPRLIIVLEPDATIPGWGGARRFDYLGYFRADQQFDRIMAAYRPERRIGPYSLWIRSAQ